MTLRKTRGVLGSAVTAALLVAGLGACSGGGDEGAGSDGGSSSSSSSGSASGSASAKPYLPVPDGVTLTPQGTHLHVGDPAVVAYRPRQDVVGALDITVTKVEKTTTKQTMSAWQLSPAQQASTPYFVHVKVANVGESDLGGRPVPLYIVNEDNLLLESTPFASSFQACPSTPFPPKFGPGTSATMCLVYLAPDHGSLEAVSFRPQESFDPIIWTGDVSKYAPPKPEKKGKKGAKKH